MNKNQASKINTKLAELLEKPNLDIMFELGQISISQDFVTIKVGKKLYTGLTEIEVDGKEFVCIQTDHDSHEFLIENEKVKYLVEERVTKQVSI